MVFGIFKKKSTKRPKNEKPQGEQIGKITHYFPHCKAGVIKLKKPLSVGDTIRIKGHTTDFKQKITSLQIDGKSVGKAKRSDEAGFLSKKRVRGNDDVYKL
jgi:hypothetical protein